MPIWSCGVFLTLPNRAMSRNRPKTATTVMITPRTTVGLLSLEASSSSRPRRAARFTGSSGISSPPFWFEAEPIGEDSNGHSRYFGDEGAEMKICAQIPSTYPRNLSAGNDLVCRVLDRQAALVFAGASLGDD